MTPIEQIKAALRCDDYAGRFLTVKNRAALCPWHQEKTPSLKLHPEFYKCHGCGAGGDIISFAAEYHGISTGAAVRMLAHELGIPLTRQPEPHPYDAAKETRIRAEAEEWTRRLQSALAASSHQCFSAHSDQVEPFRRTMDSMSRQQILAAYREQRTLDQAAMLRASIRDSDLWEKTMALLIGTLVNRLASAPEEQFPDWQYGERRW